MFRNAWQQKTIFFFKFRKNVVNLKLNVLSCPLVVLFSGLIPAKTDTFEFCFTKTIIEITFNSRRRWKQTDDRGYLFDFKTISVSYPWTTIWLIYSTIIKPTWTKSIDVWPFRSPSSLQRFCTPCSPESDKRVLMILMLCNRPNPPQWGQNTLHT